MVQVLHRAASVTWFAGQTTRGDDDAIARLIRRRVSSTAMMISGGGGALHTSAAETALNAPLFAGRRSPTTCLMLFGSWLFVAAETAPSSLIEGRCCAVAALCRIFSARANECLPAALLERFILLARTLLAQSEHDHAGGQLQRTVLIHTTWLQSVWHRGSTALLAPMLSAVVTTVVRAAEANAGRGVAAIDLALRRAAVSHAVTVLMHPPGKVSLFYVPLLHFVRILLTI